MEDFDNSESMWKLDGPIGRLDYFWVVVVMFLLFIPIILLQLTGLIVFLFPVAIILALIILYLTFVSYAKRIYDLVGSLTTAVIITIVIMILSWFIHLISLISLLICLLVPGRLIK